jgi:hypothetical protein
MSDTMMIAIVSIGYQRFAVPVDKLPDIARMFGFRAVEARYDKEYVYWYSDRRATTEVLLIPENEIHDQEPPKAADQPKVVAPPPVVKADDRLFPEATNHIPPTRDFVDEWRFDESVIDKARTM